MSGESKLVNASLFAFNNQILAMSNVVKKAKINIIQKLIRKIKLLSNKKGNEAELAKNKRKCDHLKHETESVKKAKLNDIAILALDNDGTKYEEFMKKNPKMSGEEVAIARVAFHKLVETSLDKIKKDSKLEEGGGWKKIFIQFKSRNEKRRNWKEKQKLYKEIEEKMQVKNEDDDKEAEDDDEKQVKMEAATEDEQMSTSQLATNGQEDDQSAAPAAPKKEKKEKKTKKDDKPALVDSDGHGDDDNDVAYNPEEDEELLNMQREVAFSDDDGEGSETGSMPDFGFSFGQGEEDEEEDENSDAVEEEAVPAKKKPKKAEPKMAPAVVKRDLKPLVVENKPTRMVIKQINLDELKDLNEIPIESQRGADEDGDMDDETELTVAANKSSSNHRHHQAGDYDRDYEDSKTIKATEDPFFLDPDGREIQDIHNLTEKNNALYYNNRFNKPRYRKDDGDDFDYNFDEKDQFIQKRTSLNNSSFKSSLSSRDAGYGGSGSGGYRSSYGDRSDNRGGGYGAQRRFDSSSSHRGRGDAFRPSSNGGGDYQRNKRPFESNNNSYNSYNRSSQEGAASFAKPSVDLAKNHPSWLAKKQQEEKLKSQKFEGKKITFDD